MIHVDTHVLVWVAAGELHRLPAQVAARLPSATIRISPMVPLELNYLREVGKIAAPVSEVLDKLQRKLDLRVAETSFAVVASKAWSLSWTRDPFDRLIVAGAMAEDVPLLTADTRMLANCPLAVWESWA